ncbi:MAG TPA: hypothetical protein VJC03_08890 [bacterium]|nr:hypothetical protein [bacterium]
MEFSRRPEFEKEFRHLLRKYRTLEDDLELLKKYLENLPRGYDPAVFRITGLDIETEIYKVKHFRCRAMKNKGSRSGIRVVYALFPLEPKIEFVEIYYKEKDDIDCDRERISKNYK